MSAYTLRLRHYGTQSQSASREFAISTRELGRYVPSHCICMRYTYDPEYERVLIYLLAPGMHRISDTKIGCFDPRTWLGKTLGLHTAD